MMKFRALVLAALLVTGAHGILHAQTAQTAQTAEAEVAAVIDRLFDAMRAGDSSAVRAVFHADARLSTVVPGDAGAEVRTDALDDFVRAVGAPRDDVLDERIHGLEVRVDGDLAAAWMDYRFYVGERFSHCGVNAIQFVRGADGWRMVQLTDTRRRQGCPEPPAG